MKKKKYISIGVSDYLLGIGDLTGELMRMSISCVTKGYYYLCNDINAFLKKIQLYFISFPNPSEDLQNKIKTLNESIAKVENVTLTITLRGKEYPPEVLSKFVINDLDEDQGTTNEQQ